MSYVYRASLSVHKKALGVGPKLDGLRRILLPRTRVNRAKREDRDAWCGAEETLPPPRHARRRQPARGELRKPPASAYTSAYAGISYPQPRDVASPK